MVIYKVQKYTVWHDKFAFVSNFVYIHSQAGAQFGIVVVKLPTQLAPPFSGAGLVQVLVSVRTPPPQASEQTPSTQSDQPPSTVYTHIPIR